MARSALDWFVRRKRTYQSSGHDLPQQSNVGMTLADTWYEVDVPPGTTFFEIKLLDDTIDFDVALNTSIKDAGDYKPISAGNLYYSPNPYLMPDNDRSVWVRSATASQTANVELWYRSEQ